MIRARLHLVCRAIGPALALLTFASPLLESLHGASVGHVACPEDGELIETPQQAPHQHTQASRDSGALFAERDPAAPASGQGHDHCAVMLRGRLRAGEQSRRPLVIIVPEALPAVSDPDQTPGLRRLALYRLAPKASPPLA